MSDPIVTEELELLDRVATLLQEVPYIVPPKEENILKDLVTIREEMAQAKSEDKGSLLTQYDASYALLKQLRSSRERPDVDPDSPYFAHLRLNEGGKVRDVCIGKATRIARGVRVIDWRNAPISRVFYAYKEGEEFEEEVGDTYIEGVVEARRTISIRRGKLERIDAPQGIWMTDTEGAWISREQEAPQMAGGQGSATRFHDENAAAGRSLGTNMQGHRRRADKRLPDIASLIDPEQFELITQPSSGFVVIRGTAGSGKTTVALHRIAYLAYEDKLINGPATLFLVFSKALRDYVSHVLPALGVPKVTVSTFREWAQQLRLRHFPRLPREIRDTTPAVVVRLKLHPLIGEAQQRHVDRKKGSANGDQAMDDWMSVLTDPDLLWDVFNEGARGAFGRAELEKACQWCQDRFEEMHAKWDGDKHAPAALDLEDDALLLRAWQLRVGRLRGKGRVPLEYRHVAVDEVQDLSPVEVQVLLGCLDRRQSITLAGDTQQHVQQDGGFTSWSDFFDKLGLQGTHVNTLKIAYRSTRPIVEFAVKVLGPYWEDDAMPLTTRDGPPVELFRFTEHGACVAFLADALKALMKAEPLASVAVLTPSAHLSSAYYKGLDRAELPRLRQVHNQDFEFAPGVEVTEVAQVKGLEFDYVVLVEVSANAYPDTPEARRVLHVGATRAVHQLWVTTVGSPSQMTREEETA
ncbi:MAG: DNA helicase-2/ATP-dependent DNA helicase PcrA [Myxococcota bacterium]